MTFASVEESQHDGDYIELYDWGVTPEETLRETSGRVAVVVGEDIYSPATLIRNGFDIDGDLGAVSMLEVEVPLSHTIASLFRAVSPSYLVSLTIRGLHRSDGNLEGVFAGFVVGVASSDESATIKLEAIPESLKREGLRTSFSINCPHQLFEQNSCRADPDLFRKTGSVQSVSGLNLIAAVAATEADGHWVLGDAMVAFERRLITGHSGSVLTLLSPFSSNVGGLTINLLPGCDRLRNTCRDKFDNRDNFGGFSWAPNKNPFRVGLDG